MEMTKGTAEIVRANVDLVQENMKLRAEIEVMKKRMDNMHVCLRNERYLANRYRQIRKERCQVRGWLRRVWEGMDEAWAVRVIIGTAIMCLAAIGLAEIFPRILY